jgi:hypothetical protein
VTRFRRYVEGFAAGHDEKLALHLLSITDELPRMAAKLEPR